MPLIRPGMRKPPPGFDVLQPTLEDFEDQMKIATQEESKGVVGQTTRPRHSDKSAAAPLKRPRDDDAVVEEVREENTKGGDDADANASASPAEPSASAVPPLWRMAAINRARTRYVFNAYAKTRSITKEVYDYCVEMQLIDGGLARRWRLPGYERLCCTACGVPGAASLAANTTAKYALRDKQERRVPASVAAAQQQRGGGGEETATCICRVPAAQRKNKRFMACVVCGCTGCCSADPPSEKSAGTGENGASSSS